MMTKGEKEKEGNTWSICRDGCAVRGGGGVAISAGQ